jgi:hypothetical protein
MRGKKENRFDCSVLVLFVCLPSFKIRKKKCSINELMSMCDEKESGQKRTTLTQTIINTHGEWPTRFDQQTRR